MTTIQEQARALGDPTRHRVFAYIADAHRTVDVSELTEHFGFNHNAIRQHLAKLVATGLVLEEKAPTGGRGRPRLVYRLNPAAESRWGVTGPYERLAAWLAEVVRTGDSPLEVGRRAGRREREGTEVTGDPLDGLVERMVRQGFEPTVNNDGETVEITLHSCPFESTAVIDPDTVCDLHLGMAYGLAEDLDGIEIDELVPNDPREASCRLRCHRADRS